MTTDNLTELVRTVAAAVEDLSKLVEGMPSRVEARLAQVREDFVGMAVELRGQMETLRAEAADMRGSLASMIGAVRTELDDAGAAIRSVIADNRSTFDGRLAELADDVKVFNNTVESIRGSLDGITKHADDAVGGLRMEVSETNAALQARLETTDKTVKDVRAACDTTDLYAGIATLTRGLTEEHERADRISCDVAKLGEAVEESLTVTARKVDSVNATIAENGAALLNRIVNTDARLAGLVDSVTVSHETFVGRLDQVDIANARSVEQFQTIDARISALATEVGSTEARLNERMFNSDLVINDIGERLGEVSAEALIFNGRIKADANLVDKNFEEHRINVATIRVDLLGQIDALAARVKEHETDTAATVAQLREAHKLHLTNMQTLEGVDNRLQAQISEQAVTANANSTGIAETQVWLNSMGEMLEQQVAGAVALRGKLDEVSQEVNTMRGNIDGMRVFEQATRSNLDDNDKTVLQLVEDLASTRTLTEMVNERINRLRDETTTSLNGITEELATRASTEDVQQAVQKAAEEIEAIGTRFHADLAALETSLRGALETRAEILAEADAAVGERVAQLAASVPPPMDTEALREDVLARVASLVPAMEIPQLGFDVGLAEDQSSIVFRFTDGERDISQVVPFDFGFKYRGVYKADEDYAKGNFVTHKGSMWHAKSTPTGEPGKDLAGWQLAVKCGRDGKDAAPARIKHVRDPDTGLIQESRISHDNQPPNED